MLSCCFELMKVFKGRLKGRLGFDLEVITLVMMGLSNKLCGNAGGVSSTRSS